jgi:peptidoglycan/LPS O-acetylase OafA/YrhL
VSERTQAQPRIFGLDLLRALAILLVLLCHARHFSKPYLPPESRSAMAMGYFGVELFFVLSGYLIGRILFGLLERSTSLETLRYFWIRRWFRTLPNYYLFLGINFLLALHISINTDPFWKYLFLLQNFTEKHPYFYGVAWSLAIEEWFYIFFALAVFSLSPIFGWKRSALISAILIILGCNIYRLMLATEPGLLWDAHFRKVVLFRLDAPVFGVLLAYIPAGTLHRLRWRFFTPGIILLGISILFFYLSELDSSWLAKSLFFSLSSIALVLILPPFVSWEAKETIATGIIQRLSIYSYSLYLLHWPLLVWYVKFAPTLRAEWGDHGNLALGAAFILGSIFASALLYHLFKLPLTSTRERFSGQVSGKTQRKLDNSESGVGSTSTGENRSAGNI